MISAFNFTKTSFYTFFIFISCTTIAQVTTKERFIGFGVGMNYLKDFQVSYVNQYYHYGVTDTLVITSKTQEEHSPTFRAGFRYTVNTDSNRMKSTYRIGIDFDTKMTRYYLINPDKMGYNQAYFYQKRLSTIEIPISYGWGFNFKNIIFIPSATLAPGFRYSDKRLVAQYYGVNNSMKTRHEHYYEYRSDSPLSLWAGAELTIGGMLTKDIFMSTTWGAKRDLSNALAPIFYSSIKNGVVYLVQWNIDVDLKCLKSKKSKENVIE